MAETREFLGVIHNAALRKALLEAYFLLQLTVFKSS